MTSFERRAIVLLIAVITVTLLVSPILAKASTMGGTDIRPLLVMGDGQRVEGMSGAFWVTVYGYYNSGEDHFYQEKHTAGYSLTFGHSVQIVEIRHWSDVYNYYPGVGTYTYNQYVHDAASTRMILKVYFFGIYIDTISLTATIIAP